MTSTRAMMRKVSVSILSLLTVGLTVGLAQPAQAAGVTKTLIVHYQDPSNNSFDTYKDWSMWGWLNGTTTDSLNPPMYFNGSDSFGKTFTKTFSDAAGINYVGLIVRKNDWSTRASCTPADPVGSLPGQCTGDDNGNRFVVLTGATTEIWIVKGTAEPYYTSAAAATAAGAVPSTWDAGAVDPNFDCVDGVCEPHVEMPATQNLIIHLQDPAATGFNNYKGWDLYMYALGGSANFGTANAFGGYYASGSDSFGKVLNISVTSANKTKKIGVIVRKSNWSDRWACSGCSGDGNGNRTVDLSATGTTELWIVKGADKAAYYTSLEDAQAAGAGSAPWADGAVDPSYTCDVSGCVLNGSYPANQRFVLHYNRTDGDYGDCSQPTGTCWNVWMWGTPGNNDQNLFTGSDSFGKVLTVNFTGNTTLMDGWGFLLRSTKSWDDAKKDGDNRSVTITESSPATSERWIFQGNQKTYALSDFVAPTITSVSTTTGGPGTAVTLFGTNLDTASSVKIGTKAVSFRRLSATAMVFTVPTGATTGKISVSNPAAQSALSASNFTVTTAVAKATITSTTANGLVGDTVTVKGANIGAATDVKLGLISVPFNVVNAGEINFVVPKNAVDGKISITTTSAGSATSAKAFALKPVLTSATSSVAVGGTVNIVGKNLSTVTAVKLGTKAITGFTKGATTISFTVPTGTVSGKVSLTSPGGTVSSDSNVTIIPAPKVTTVSGTLKTGTPVAVSGSGFTGATRVMIGATQLSNFKVNSDTSISFTAPAAGITGKVSVTTPGGTASSAAAITIKS